MSAGLPLDELIERYLAETAETAEIEELQKRLRGSAEAADTFVVEALFDALLTAKFTTRTNASGVKIPIEPFSGNADATGAETPIVEWPVAGDPCEQYPPSAFIPHPSSFLPHPSSIPPIIVDPTPVHHSPVGSFVFSHIAAAVILGIGLLLGLAWRISLPTSERQEPGGTGYASASPVGRITALADCKARQWSVASGQWSEITNHKLKIINQKFSPGDRFAVSSGLMEITYDTGAKVILEGPCTYEIDSDRGGYLAVGKLTARVEKRSEGGGRRADNADHYQLPTTNYQLFAIRTPTATVTDLGTEFGVEVEESGATRSHVFQGSVELVASGQWPVASDGNSRRSTTSGDAVEILHAGQSARVERGRNQKINITRELGRPDRFVRHISQSTNGQISKSPSLIPGSRPLTPRYRLIDLGTLGGAGSQAFAMNAAGHVVGRAAAADGAMRAFLHAGGMMIDLDALHGGNSCAYGINALNQVVGQVGDASGGQRAFLYRDGIMEDLGTFGGQYACARDINDAGMIVGAAQSVSGVPRAFLYTAGAGMKDLGSLGGRDAESGAIDINNNGMVMGYSETQNGPNRAFVYRAGDGMKDIGGLNDKDRTLGYGMNAVGQVVGCSVAEDKSRRAFLYSADEGMRDLGSFGGKVNQALGINAAGDIVGYANVKGINHAFLYRHGTMVDLNTWVAPATGWILYSAAAINDSGWIAGYGKAPGGGVRAFLLKPEKGPEIRNER